MIQNLTLCLLFLFTTNCLVSRYLDCPNGKCESDINPTLGLLGLSSSVSCDLPAESGLGGMQDDPALYTSFSNRIADSEWNETAIRRILHTFAWGGPASDSQIAEWVKLGSDKAIVQILSADPINPRLNQPVLGSAISRSQQASVFCLTRSLSSGTTPFLGQATSGIGIDSSDSNAISFPLIAQMKGLNPVRNYLGYIETNYHMATNSELVGPRPQLRLFDETMNSIARGESYQNILANSALSPAIAIQYNHRRNRFTDAQFLGNEDFAREYHQLFFGILGTGGNAGDITQSNTAFQTHERQTVPETAKALTDLRVGEFNSTGTNIDSISYGRDFHLDRPVILYGQSVGGSTAREKIQNAAQLSINQTESLNNLPLRLIRALADDNLDEDRISGNNPDASIQNKATQIREIWAGTNPKNLLIFLRRYALSTAFHNASRIKYRTSADRLFTISNLVTLENGELSFGLHGTRNLLNLEDVQIFSPAHDVFGGQTGVEAKDTADVFRQAFNTSSETPDQWGIGFRDDRGTTVYRKRYDLIIPKGVDGRWRVKETAEWLWNRFIGDGLKNLGNLERAHLYALLGSGTDLNYFLARDKRDSSINTISYGWGDGGSNDIALNTDLQTRISDAAVATLTLDDFGDRGNEARRRVGLAINFIVSTPYMFALEGK